MTKFYKQRTDLWLPKVRNWTGQYSKRTAQGILAVMELFFFNLILFFFILFLSLVWIHKPTPKVINCAELNTHT